MSKTRETVTELTANSSGVWWVHTTGGTVHIWDCDAGTILRSPGAASLTGEMRFDGTPVQVLEVRLYPEVGAGFLLAFQHPTDPERVVVRGSSDIVKIQRAPR